MRIEIDRKAFDKSLQKAMFGISVDIANELAMAAPVDTGRLKNSINASFDMNTVTISMVEYAKYVEFGTPPHIIRPKNAKALHWKAGGKDVFAAAVHHPGTRPNPFIRNTFNNKGTEIIIKNLKKAFT